MVPICSKHHIFLIPVYHWFADEIGLCVTLTLYLWEHKNCV
jgi:hypothetical protein